MVVVQVRRRCNDQVNERPSFYDDSRFKKAACINPLFRGGVVPTYLFLEPLNVVEHEAELRRNKPGNRAVFDIWLVHR
jgi:hypothetical protein